MVSRRVVFPAPVYFKVDARKYLIFKPSDNEHSFLLSSSK
jgi:hypothetical protein